VDRHSAWPANSGGRKRWAPAERDGCCGDERASSSLGPVDGLKYRQLTVPLKSTVVYSRIFLELFCLFQIVPLASVGISFFFSRGSNNRRLCALLRDLRFTSVTLLLHQQRSCVGFDGMAPCSAQLPNVVRFDVSARLTFSYGKRLALKQEKHDCSPAINLQVHRL
jgi:hypothetical protein